MIKKYFKLKNENVKKKNNSSSVSMLPKQSPLCVFVHKRTNIQCTPPPAKVPAHLKDECKSIDKSLLVSTTMDQL